MYLRKSIKVPQWETQCFYAILTSFLLIGQGICSDSNNNYNSDVYASSRKIPSSGSGGGTIQKRSSYAVIQQAMSETISNEFGSE